LQFWQADTVDLCQLASHFADECVYAQSGDTYSASNGNTDPNRHPNSDTKSDGYNHANDYTYAISDTVCFTCAARVGG